MKYELKDGREDSNMKMCFSSFIVSHLAFSILKRFPSCPNCLSEKKVCKHYEIPIHGVEMGN